MALEEKGLQDVQGIPRICHEGQCGRPCRRRHHRRGLRRHREFPGRRYHHAADRRDHGRPRLLQLFHRRCQSQSLQAISRTRKNKEPCWRGACSAAAVCTAVVGVGLSRALRRVLARARQSFLGRHLRGDRVPAAARGFAAQGLVPDDRHRDRRHDDRGADRVLSAGSHCLSRRCWRCGAASALSPPRCCATSRPTRRRSPAIRRRSSPPTRSARPEARVRTSSCWRSTRASEICIGIVCAGIVLAGTDLGGAQRRLAASFADLAAEIAGRFTRMLALAGPQLPDTQAERRELRPARHRARPDDRPGARGIQPRALPLADIADSRPRPVRSAGWLARQLRHI